MNVHVCVVHVCVAIVYYAYTCMTCVCEQHTDVTQSLHPMVTLILSLQIFSSNTCP
jgi:hypothetical protein